MKGKLILNVERMEDTCSPGKNVKLYTFRAYSIVIPMIFVILFLEAIFILAKMPGSSSVGSALTIKGPLSLPQSMKIST